jgi:hypothetical protein
VTPRSFRPPLSVHVKRKSGKLGRREILPQFGTLHYTPLYNENRGIHVSELFEPPYKPTPLHTYLFVLLNMIYLVCFKAHLTTHCNIQKIALFTKLIDQSEPTATTSTTSIGKACYDSVVDEKSS